MAAALTATGSATSCPAAVSSHPGRRRRGAGVLIGVVAALMGVAGGELLIQEVRHAIGANPGAGQPFTSHGSSQCQFGSYQSGLVLANLTPTRGIAGYDLVHYNPKVSQSMHVVDITGVGDRAFETTAPHTASIYFDKGDALLLVMVETQTLAPPVAQVLALAKSAAGRI